MRSENVPRVCMIRTIDGMGCRKVEEETVRVRMIVKKYNLDMNELLEKKKHNRYN